MGIRATASTKITPRHHSCTGRRLEGPSAKVFVRMQNPNDLPGRNRRANGMPHTSTGTAMEIRPRETTVYVSETFEPTTFVVVLEGCPPTPTTAGAPLTTDLCVLPVLRITSMSTVIPSVSKAIFCRTAVSRQPVPTIEPWRDQHAEGTYRQRLRLVCRDSNRLQVNESARTSYPAFLAGKYPLFDNLGDI